MQKRPLLSSISLQNLAQELSGGTGDGSADATPSVDSKFKMTQIASDTAKIKFGTLEMIPEAFHAYTDLCTC